MHPALPVTCGINWIGYCRAAQLVVDVRMVALFAVGANSAGGVTEFTAILPPASAEITFATGRKGSEFIAAVPGVAATI